MTTVSRPTPGSGAHDGGSSRRARLGHVLDGMRFPAARWELITHAEHYGADADTKRELFTIPELGYRSLADVALAIERAAAQRP